VDGAAFQPAVGLGGLLHGHGLVCAQAQSAISQERHGLVQGAGSTIGSGLGERLPNFEQVLAERLDLGQHADRVHDAMVTSGQVSADHRDLVTPPQG
jgi:hypothetical protein